MDFKRGNIFTKALMPADGTELTEIILDQNRFRIERIVSDGQSTPDGFWYDQPGDEWVILLQGDAVVEFEESGDISLSKGDYLWIPPHVRHRVKFTSNKPQCIWLACHSSQ
ncbi:MAG: cupin domain-containing protein [Bacteroidales bacterium]